MTPAQLTVALNKAAKACETACNAAIEAARQKYVIPFCDRHGCKFLAGMGSWGFHGGDIGHIWDTEDSRLGARLAAVLREPYPLNRGNDCGSLMADYTPSNYRERT